MAAGHIPAGVVDERSITEIKPHELAGYHQQHFFAGIGGWAYALRLAGWADDRPVRTGSCPCQPFSQAGQGKGEADERHLWPIFRDLIAFGEPTVTFGEQVASAAGREWLAGIRADLEGLGYEVGAADLCAAGVGAPHIRQRLYWLANATGQRRDWRKLDGNETGRRLAANCCTARGLADTASMSGAQQLAEPRSGSRRGPSPADSAECAGPCGVGNADSPRLSEQRGPVTVPQELSAAELRGHSWDTFELLPCTDGKARRIESGTFPLADGVPGRMGLLRGYGNAIVPEVAAEFVAAWDSLNEWNESSGGTASRTPPSE